MTEVLSQVSPAQRQVPLSRVDALHPMAVERVELPRQVSVRSPRAFMHRYRMGAVLLDLAACGAGTGLACLARFQGTAPLLYALLLGPLWLGIVATQRGYESRFLGTGPEEYRRIMNSGLIFFAAIAVVAFSVKFDLSRGYVLMAVPITVALALLGRHFLRRWVYRLRLRGHGLQRVLLVGRADSAAATVDFLRREPEHGLVAVGLCIPRSDLYVSHVHDVPVVGWLDNVLEAVDRTAADVVAVVSHPDLSGTALRRLAWSLEESRIDLLVSPGIIEVAGPRLSIRPVAGLSLLHLERPSLSGGRLIVKATLDRLAGLAILALASPVVAVAALAVRLTSSGPALFRQTRVGAHGQEFTMYKLRSMVHNAQDLRSWLEEHNEADGALFKIRNDPRITRVGAFLRRYSIDELPQLWNVVRGEMSLVGPRPPLPEEVASYTSDAIRRLRVRPGLTGLWQVSGRSDLSWEESLRLDLRYVDNWSWALDAAILWRTSKAIVGRSGAY
jgi:exopolysaccharide biosynthesis polyprenyl glycosylphosphotransferase